MPNLTGGGAERVASILVNQFAESGVETTLVLVKNDIIEYRIDSRVKIDKSIMHESGTRNPIQQILDIRSYMKKRPCGTFISFLTYQNFYAALANIGQNHKLILSLRNAPDKIQGGGIIPKLSAMILLLTLRSGLKRLAVFSPTIEEIRAFISFAALFVKVRAIIRSGERPKSNR